MCYREVNMLSKPLPILIKQSSSFLNPYYKLRDVFYNAYCKPYSFSMFSETYFASYTNEEYVRLYYCHLCILLPCNVVYNPVFS